VGTVHIHNIYNPSPGSGQGGSLNDLRRALASLQGHHLVVGDFNLHHPLWSRPGYEHIHAEADELLDIAMDHELTQQKFTGDSMKKRIRVQEREHPFG